MSKGIRLTRLIIRINSVSQKYSTEFNVPQDFLKIYLLVGFEISKNGPDYEVVEGSYLDGLLLLVSDTEYNETIGMDFTAIRLSIISRLKELPKIY